MPENDGSTLNNVQRFKLCDEEAHKERAYISNRLIGMSSERTRMGDCASRREVCSYGDLVSGSTGGAVVLFLAEYT